MVVVVDAVVVVVGRAVVVVVVVGAAVVVVVVGRAVVVVVGAAVVVVVVGRAVVVVVVGGAKAAAMACICAVVSATPPLVARIEFLMLLTPAIPLAICDADAPLKSDDASGPWQPSQFWA